jgi:hypothetical protein
MADSVTDVLVNLERDPFEGIIILGSNFEDSAQAVYQTQLSQLSLSPPDTITFSSWKICSQDSLSVVEHGARPRSWIHTAIGTSLCLAGQTLAISADDIEQRGPCASSATITLPPIYGLFPNARPFHSYEDKPLPWNGTFVLRWHQAGHQSGPCTSVQFQYRKALGQDFDGSTWSDWIDCVSSQDYRGLIDGICSVQLRLRLQTESSDCTPVIDEVLVIREPVR